ncbi:hypothetical protein DM02DRAFT_627534 [Periconia macrospinosa]|uniref:Mid2 domain-containing protein n=1 Tax=Periconia macrospinosa TaxID=97972 RepID=A0A2V1DWK3_9PLEO|nr:hypothetical protein DM02DRAFT_627534 [Periconia macrospinosa]
MYSATEIRDVCLDNGLCMSNYTENKQLQTQYWLNFCVYKNWSTPGCLDICSGSRDNNTGSARMTPCGNDPTSTSWCCGNTNDCCITKTGVINLPIKFDGKAISSSQSSATPASTQSNTSSPSPHAPHSQDPKGLSTGAKAGIGVGATLGVLLLLGALIFVRKALAWRRRACTNQQHPQPEKADAFKGNYPGMQFNEMSDGRTDVNELPVYSQPVELPPETRTQ